MECKSKYSVGDTVYFFSNGGISAFKISEVHIMLKDNTQHTGYKSKNMLCAMAESAVFKTEAEAKKRTVELFKEATKEVAEHKAQ